MVGVLAIGERSGPMRARLASGLACAYVDATVWEEWRIGTVHARLDADGPAWSGPAGLLLSTCQRVELYTDDRYADPVSDHPLAPEAVGIRGEAAVRRRLAEIAAGVRSRVLGERFVLQQLEAAGRRLPAGHVLGLVVAEAVGVARRLRAEHGLTAAMDYPDLAGRMLAETGDDPSRVLLVIGGGALARAVVGHELASRYRRVVIVTRSPKRLRRRLSAVCRRPTACSPAGAWPHLRGSRWDAVVATTNLTEGYRDLVAELVTHPDCRTAIDLSCVPLFRLAPAAGRYVHMYDERFALPLRRPG